MDKDKDKDISYSRIPGQAGTVIDYHLAYTASNFKNSCKRSTLVIVTFALSPN